MAKKSDAFFQTPIPPTPDKTLARAVADMRDEVRTSMSQLFEQNKKMDMRVTASELRIDKLFKAFPEGDTEGHARYHQVLIDMAEEKRRLWKAIIEKTLSALAWSLVLALGWVAWHNLLNFVNYVIETATASKGTH